MSFSDARMTCKWHLHALKNVNCIYITYIKYSTYHRIPSDCKPRLCSKRHTDFEFFEKRRSMRSFSDSQNERQEYNCIRSLNRNNFSWLISMYMPSLLIQGV